MSAYIAHHLWSLNVLQRHALKLEKKILPKKKKKKEEEEEEKEKKKLAILEDFF